MQSQIIVQWANDTRDDEDGGIVFYHCSYKVNGHPTSHCVFIYKSIPCIFSLYLLFPGVVDTTENRHFSYSSNVYMTKMLRIAKGDMYSTIYNSVYSIHTNLDYFKVSGCVIE